MSYAASVIISTFQRPKLLDLGLYSLAGQNIPFDFETIVINDGVIDETESVCEKYRKNLNLKYVFSGQRNLNGEVKWRVPGFAVNIGAKQAIGKVLIISCAEMFSLNDTVAKLTQPLLENPKFLGLPVGKDDRDGSFLKGISSIIDNTDKSFDIDSYCNYPDLNVFLPFFMSVHRDEFFAIGGYDEDFTGIAWDDNDIVDRLVINGCSFFQTDAKVVHLYHPRYVHGKGVTPEFLLNRNLYISRRGRIIRNENREWGKI